MHRKNAKQIFSNNIFKSIISFQFNIFITRRYRRLLFWKLCGIVTCFMSLFTYFFFPLFLQLSRIYYKPEVYTLYTLRMNSPFMIEKKNSFATSLCFHLHQCMLNHNGMKIVYARKCENNDNKNSDDIENGG